jgi:predicted transcriptional regulator
VNSTIKSEARVALDRGWSVIPVTQGTKKPATKWKDFQELLPTEEQLERWAIDYPDANIAFVTGPMSGIGVLDIDPAAGGDKSMDRLVSSFGNLPETPAVLTGGGGYHYYFKYPPGGLRNSAGKLGDGIDIRGDGGYVIAPPSIHTSGKPYRWAEGRNPDDVPLAPMPDWLVTKLCEPEVSPETKELKKQIQKGLRHKTLLSQAGLMHSKGLGSNAIRAALLAENKEVCDPPLSEKEVLELVQDITQRYKPGKLLQVEDANPLNFIPPKEWLGTPEKPVEWLVDNILPKGSLTMLSAPPKVGKSTFARQMAMAVATGTPFLGKNVTQGEVLLLAIEEPENNVRGAFRRLGIKDDTALHIHFGRIGPHVTDQLREVVLKKEPSLVIIDTVGRIRPDKLETNDYTSTEAWLEPFLYLAHETATTVCLIYHTTKSGRSLTGHDALFAIMGSVGISATIDHLIGLTRKPDGSRTVFTVGRYGETPETVLAFEPGTERLTALGTAKTVAMSKMQSDILELLQEGSKTTKEIKDEIIGRGETISKALKSLYEDGFIDRTGSGSRNEPYTYSLRDSGIVKQADSGMDSLRRGFDSLIPATTGESGNQIGSGRRLITL